MSRSCSEPIPSKKKRSVISHIISQGNPPCACPRWHSPARKRARAPARARLCACAPARGRRAPARLRDCARKARRAEKYRILVRAISRGDQCMVFAGSSHVSFQFLASLLPDTRWRFLKRYGVSHELRLDHSKIALKYCDLHVSQVSTREWYPSRVQSFSISATGSQLRVNKLYPRNPPANGIHCEFNPMVYRQLEASCDQTKFYLPATGASCNFCKQSTAIYQQLAARCE